MKDLLLLSILIEKYKTKTNNQELPHDFNKKEPKEQIELLIKSLENNKSLEEIIEEDNKNNYTLS